MFNDYGESVIFKEDTVLMTLFKRFQNNTSFLIPKIKIRTRHLS